MKRLLWLVPLSLFSLTALASSNDNLVSIPVQVPNYSVKVVLKEIQPNGATKILSNTTTRTMAGRRTPIETVKTDEKTLAGCGGGLDCNGQGGQAFNIHMAVVPVNVTKAEGPKEALLVSDIRSETFWAESGTSKQSDQRSLDSKIAIQLDKPVTVVDYQKNSEGDHVAVEVTVHMLPETTTVPLLSEVGPTGGVGL